jgi:hypothetical protein
MMVADSIYADESLDRSGIKAWSGNHSEEIDES